MLRLRLIFALFLGLSAPGMGLGLVSNADEGIRLYFVFLLISILRVQTVSVGHPGVLPPWAVEFLKIIVVWGVWALIDVANVIHRARKKELLPEISGSFPPSLLCLACLFTLFGLAFIPGRYFPQLNFTQITLPLTSWLGPIFIIIADRLLRRRRGWRIFTIIVLSVSLAFSLLFWLFTFTNLANTISTASLRELIAYFSQIAFILASLIILFLPSTRTFFQKPDSSEAAIQRLLGN